MSGAGSSRRRHSEHSNHSGPSGNSHGDREHGGLGFGRRRNGRPGSGFASRGHGSRRAAFLASSLAAVAVTGALTYAALPGSPASATPAPVRAEPSAAPFGASCRIAVERSQVVSYCHNPYAQPDLVRLHTECGRWWDIDGDSAPVEVGPAETVRLTSRCWKEVADAWVSHAYVPEPPLLPVRPGGSVPLEGSVPRKGAPAPLEGPVPPDSGLSPAPAP
ncbi:hypothetical protein [Streptomyces sp. NPDC051561]|uniref:hypothetical protein n=1 Tax=Streptomyces sp. NPDC051561 TaxID=3365658 RepID=UPI0037BBA900